ncbi:MAG: site-specific integrase [candidate division Zixibacteria bacterium]|nr:site-specific integrase [candidate division Zixibacteria bacterium]MDD5426114.1 site-specific integrase [candidate division Zixibacteria bacterium]
MARIYKRKNIWYIDIRVKGRRIRKKVGHSKRVAELALKDAEVKIAREEFGFTNKDITIEKLIELFLDYNRVNNRLSTTNRYKAITDHLSNYLKEKCPDVIMLSQLKEDIIEGYRSYRRNAWVNPNGSLVKSDDDVKEYTRQGARARTINLEVDGVKAMLNMAIRWGYLKDNPLKLVKPLKEDDKKPLRFLTIEESNKLLETVPPDLFPVYFTFLNTGMRKAELENLRWSDVDFKRRIILIRGKDDWKPKTGEREIPINDSLYTVLEDLKANSKTTSNDDYVFKAKKSGYSHNRLRRELIKIGEKVGIEGLTKLHTLRHTFASHLVMGGVDLPTVQKLMGHSDIQTTMIYAHLAPDHLAKAVTKLPFKKR